MIVLFVYGVPEETTGILGEFTATLINTVAYSTKEFKLEGKDIACFFPKDLMAQGLGEEVVIFVDGLTEAPERTEAAKNSLALAICRTTHLFFPDTNNIECVIRPFSQGQGFGSFSQERGFRS